MTEGGQAVCNVHAAELTVDVALQFLNLVLLALDASVPLSCCSLMLWV